MQVPRAVINECMARSQNTDAQRIQLVLDPQWLKPCEPTPVLTPGLDLGERAAIASAMQLGTGLLRDVKALEVVCPTHHLDGAAPSNLASPAAITRLSEAERAPICPRTSRWSSVKSLKRSLDGAGNPAAARSKSGQSSGQGGLPAEVTIAITEWPAGVLNAVDQRARQLGGSSRQIFDVHGLYAPHRGGPIRTNFPGNQVPGNDMEGGTYILRNGGLAFGANFGDGNHDQSGGKPFTLVRRGIDDPWCGGAANFWTRDGRKFKEYCIQ